MEKESLSRTMKAIDMSYEDFVFAQMSVATHQSMLMATIISKNILDFMKSAGHDVNTVEFEQSMAKIMETIPDITKAITQKSLQGWECMKKPEEKS